MSYTNEIDTYFSYISEIPDFLKKYLEVDILKRLKKVGYLCGMDFASNDIYDFKFFVSRFDHSLSTALLTWKFTSDKTQTIAALFHDVATPVFSHVIDYMLGDYETQETTEEKTKEIINSSKDLISCLEEDKILIEDIIDFKKYSIVDNKRPKLCADRLDGIILTSLIWTKELKLDEIPEILKHTCIFKNEENNLELGFNSLDIAKKLVYLNDVINTECHSSYDNYMMELLAKITKYAIDKNIITYDELYKTDEFKMFALLNEVAKTDDNLQAYLNEFKNKKKKDITKYELSKVKNRNINPLVNGKRFN